MLSPSQIQMVRVGINVVASASVWKIVQDVVKSHVVVEKPVDVVKVWTGSLIIGSMVADAASKHVNEKFDAVLDWADARGNADKPDVPANGG